MMLSNVKWGKYIIGDLFERIETAKLPYKADELPKQPCGEYVIPCLTSSFRNQGLNYYVPREGATILQHVISIPSNSDVYRAYYQSREFTVLSDAYAIRWKNKAETITSSQYLFMVMCINKITDLPIYSYKNKLGGWNVVKNKPIMLPVKNEKIDFKFMDDFIAELEAERVAELEAERVAELEAYLSVTGLKDTQLTADELSAVNDLISKNIEFKPFCYDVIFDKIVQGRRLKKDDQIAGDIPFVMAGVTNTGVVGYISNPVASFPKNSITIDIFGNAFYRNYDFGAGDDTGVYWSEKSDYSKEIMLFLTCSMGKSIENKFSYGKKLRSSQSFKFKMQLPVKNEQPDYELMSTLISAIQKLVIADVVKFSDEKIKATKQVVG